MERKGHKQKRVDTGQGPIIGLSANTQSVPKNNGQCLIVDSGNNFRPIKPKALKSSSPLLKSVLST